MVKIIASNNYGHHRPHSLTLNFVSACLVVCLWANTVDLCRVIIIIAIIIIIIININNIIVVDVLLVVIVVAVQHTPKFSFAEVEERI